MKGDLGKLMQQAQQLQKDMEKAQKELSDLKIIGESGGGLVKVMMTGRHDVKKVQIESKLLDEDKDVIEDMVAAAVNDAVRKVEKLSKQKMTNLAEGMGLPPGMELPTGDGDK
ncbi:MAG: YbaB/EbfC family nucleoid-associated protein [Legionellales bacterium]|nr:YbaB/EbfC family nucleoid-associated protein [Legionellales bacterium]|tara:strand:- start:23247 stop:23585 length:339 start_codon:yes stop_codon:yes gene_type:complete